VAILSSPALNISQPAVQTTLESGSGCRVKSTTRKNGSVTANRELGILDREHQVVEQLGDGKRENGDVGSRRSQSRAQFTPGNFITPHDAATGVRGW